MSMPARAVASAVVLAACFVLRDSRDPVDGGGHRPGVVLPLLVDLLLHREGFHP